MKSFLFSIVASLLLISFVSFSNAVPIYDSDTLEVENITVDSISEVSVSDLFLIDERPQSSDYAIESVTYHFSVEIIPITEIVWQSLPDEVGWKTS